MFEGSTTDEEAKEGEAVWALQGRGSHKDTVYRRLRFYLFLNIIAGAHIKKI